ncbi:hypothetical protein B0A81_04295 [Flavobacterium plurextorum]|uniref:Transposase n=1 Tax=Flavobacterium plurextorum TaxID=1114867 RepID=A0ABX4CZJ4_9FLAO|nr:hypothetical protein B0A81_04295 [Flavobacterium plurextorum]
MVQEVITPNSAITKILKDFISNEGIKLFKMQHKAIRFKNQSAVKFKWVFLTEKYLKIHLQLGKE